MFFRNIILPRLGAGLVACALFSGSAYSQQGNSPTRTQNEVVTVEGTVVSSSLLTLVVKSDDNQFHLFTWDSATVKPRTLPAGARVRVGSEEGDEEGARHATNIALLEPAQNGSAYNSSAGSSASSSSVASSANASARDAAPVPSAVKNVDNQIQRDAKRWRLGVRAGVGLDPELVMFGVHSQIGPVFSRNVFFRPNADFEWGEVTDMVALNLEAVYRIPNARRTTWAPYLGAGPSLNFIHQSFRTQNGQSRNISFDNFNYETGFNLLAGFQNRHGTFFEVKTSLYSQPAPVVRLIVGRNF
jgi:hypothetical protein